MESGKIEQNLEIRKIYTDIDLIKQHNDYLAKNLDDIMKRVAELESMILGIKDIDWKTIKYRNDETF